MILCPEHSQVVPLKGTIRRTLHFFGVVSLTHTHLKALDPLKNPFLFLLLPLICGSFLCFSTQASEQKPELISCEILAKLTGSLLDHTQWQKTRYLVTDPHFNQAAFRAFLRRIDYMKLYLTEEDINLLKAENIDTQNIALSIAEHRASQRSDLIKKTQVVAKCPYVEATFEIFHKSLNLIAGIILELLETDLNYDLRETILLVPPESYAKNHEELKERWRKRIKFEMLIATNLWHGHGGDSLTPDPKVQKYLRGRYQQLLYMRDTPLYHYYLWLQAFYDVIDPGAVVTSHHLPNNFFLASWRSIYSTLPFIRDYEPEHMVFLDPSKYLEIPRIRDSRLSKLSVKNSYPQEFLMDFFEFGSYILSGYQTKRHQKFLVLEPKQSRYEYVLKQYPKNEASISYSGFSSYTLKMSDAGKAMEVLYLKIESFPHDIEKDSSSLTGRLHRYLRQFLEEVGTTADTVVVDMRGSTFLGFSSAQFLDLFSGLFVRHSLVAQECFRKNSIRKALTPKVIGGHCRQYGHDPFGEDVPLVILTDNRSTGYGEMFAHSLRLMKRALILGTGVSDKTSGKVSRSHYALLNGGRIRHTYSVGVSFHIDGSLATGQGVPFDIYIHPNPSAMDTYLQRSSRARHPWHMIDPEFFEVAQLKPDLKKLDYVNHGMVTSEMIAQLSGLHQDRQSQTPEASQSYDLNVSLRWQDFQSQIQKNLLENQDLDDTIIHLQNDKSLFESEGSYAVNPYALKLLEQDEVLMQALRITADYYSLLKLGRPADNPVITTMRSSKH